MDVWASIKKSCWKGTTEGEVCSCPPPHLLALFYQIIDEISFIQLWINNIQLYNIWMFVCNYNVWIDEM